MTGSDAYIRIQGLSKYFREGSVVHRVFEEVDAGFHRGEFAALLGKSGSGKSTLLNLISGIEKPTRGSIIIGGVDITGLREHERTLFRRDHIGFVFQFFNLIPTLTVVENVTLPQELAGRDRHLAEMKAMDLLERVGLADRRDTFPDRLSGGEQQRVAIARALAHDPELILADEPTGNLDEETGQPVLELLLQLTRSAGATLIMATHDQDIARLADRVFLIHEGKVTEEKREGARDTAIRAMAGSEEVKGVRVDV
ncbi:MAG: ABC transporter ATP-binding protein [Caldilineae bacterium]|nr:MAG: ABC transporter ATP-binding protein [Caldilineae bacterium]